VNLEFARDVCSGLSRPQKELDSKYLYDDLGSALFEAITLLPEYGLTRADNRLLAAPARELPESLASASKAVGPSLIVADVGSGGGRKARPILESLRPVHYYPIDLSSAALERCALDLAGLALVTPVGLSYLDGIREVTSRRGPGERLLVLFAGSNIGNFVRSAREEFIAELRVLLRAGDALLLGCDLVKPLETMLVAYDDPAGVTAAFNLNMLGRINRELGADFELRSFRHEARYDGDRECIEMHLRSLRHQIVTLRDVDRRFVFEEGQTVRTESSHKFRHEVIPEMARRVGFHFERQWIDEEWPFSESLWTAV